MTTENRRHPSARASDFVVQAAANAVGTLVATLTVFLLSVALGAFPDVPTRLIFSAGVGLSALVVAWLGALWLSRELSEMREAARIYDRVRRPMERCEAALRESEKYNANDGILRMIDASRAAEMAGDIEESKRLLADARNAAASGKAALEEAKRRRDEAFAAVDASGFPEWRAAGHRLRLGRLVARLVRMAEGAVLTAYRR